MTKVSTKQSPFLYAKFYKDGIGYYAFRFFPSTANEVEIEEKIAIFRSYMDRVDKATKAGLPVSRLEFMDEIKDGFFENTADEELGFYRWALTKSNVKIDASLKEIEAFVKEFHKDDEYCHFSFFYFDDEPAFAVSALAVLDLYNSNF